MSEDGSKFTYVNQLASSNTDVSRRAEWFTCACCPPNVARLLGYIGGYLCKPFLPFREEDQADDELGTSSSDAKNNSVEVNVHTYASAVLSIPVGEQTVQLEQTTDWPWNGNIRFELQSPEAISTTIRLRIPSWAEEWTVRDFPHCKRRALIKLDISRIRTTCLQSNKRILNPLSSLSANKPIVPTKHHSQTAIHLTTSLHEPKHRRASSRPDNLLRGRF